MDFKMAAICFTLLCISLPVALWKENKNALYLGKFLTCGNCHHMAVISEFKTAATLLDMPFSMIDMSLTFSVITEKDVISPFSSEGSNFQFHDDGCINCRSCSVLLRIPRYMSTYHSSSRLLITGPTTFAKWGAFHVCLETIAIPLARLRESTFARYQFKASYLSDRQCGPFRNITGSLGCFPSPISNVWKFRLYFQ